MLNTGQRTALRLCAVIAGVLTMAYILAPQTPCAAKLGRAPIAIAVQALL